MLRPRAVIALAVDDPDAVFDCQCCPRTPFFVDQYLTAASSMKVPLVFKILRVQVSSALHVRFLKSVESKPWPEIHCFVDRNQGHVLLWDVVHVLKSDHSGLALCGGDEEVYVAHA